MEENNKKVRTNRFSSTSFFTCRRLCVKSVVPNVVGTVTRNPFGFRLRDWKSCGHSCLAWKLARRGIFPKWYRRAPEKKIPSQTLFQRRQCGGGLNIVIPRSRIGSSYMSRISDDDPLGFFVAWKLPIQLRLKVQHIPSYIYGGWIQIFRKDTPWADENPIYRIYPPTCNATNFRHKHLPIKL